MFGFLKDKLKDAISKFSKKAEEIPMEKPVEEKIVEQTKKEETAIAKKEEKSEIKEELKEKKGFFTKIKEKIIEEQKEEIKADEKREEKAVETIEEKKSEEKPKEKKGFFESIKEKVTTIKIDEGKFDEFFNELELTLLENNVAYEVVEKIKKDLKKDIVDRPIKRGEVESIINESLMASIEGLFLVQKIGLLEMIEKKEDKPFVICFLGQNGSGKTTSIAKIAHYLKEHKQSVVLAAADTFRAASIEQIKEWGTRLNVKVIAHDYGGDAASVAFDGIKYCKAHNIDVLLVDTAGRQHSNQNLMREMEKIVRVTKPDLKIFVGEAITGGDVILQSEEFNNTVGIDGIILTKADVDEKGGAIVSISYVTHRPIMFLGTGQMPEDMKEFDKRDVMKNLGLV